MTETQLVAFKDQKVQRSVETATALITVQRCRCLVTFAPYTILLSYLSIYTKKYQTQFFLFNKKDLYMKLSRYLLCTNRQKFQHIFLDFLKTFKRRQIQIQKRNFCYGNNFIWQYFFVLNLNLIKVKISDKSNQTLKNFLILCIES